MKRLIHILVILVMCLPCSGAEFLIYNKDHWMDALTPTQLTEYTKKYPNFMHKYNARYQRGDIIEVKPDGFYTRTLNGDLSRWPFRVIAIPGLKADNMYVEPVMQDDLMIKRSKYNIQDGATETVYTVSKIEHITLIDKTSITKDHEEDILFIVRALTICLFS